MAADWLNVVPTILNCKVVAFLVVQSFANQLIVSDPCIFYPCREQSGQKHDVSLAKRMDGQTDRFHNLIWSSNQALELNSC